MSQSATIPLPIDAPCVGEVAYYTTWLRELDECHTAGLVSTEDYFVQRAERLEEILLRPHHIWLAWILATLPLATLVGGIVLFYTHNWHRAGLAAGLGALFGCAMLGHACAEKMRHSQLLDRIKILRTLLAHDLISAEELIRYEERMA